MKKQHLQTIAIVLIALSASFAGCTKADSPNLDAHHCPCAMCPYRGLQSFTGVIHTGQVRVDREMEGTDLYYIDILHFVYPCASYDELEERASNRTNAKL